MNFAFLLVPILLFAPQITSAQGYRPADNATSDDKALIGILPPPDVTIDQALTSDEMNAFGLALQSCWNIDSLSAEAALVTVVAGFRMATDGKPQPNSIRMLSASGGSNEAAKQAFEAARRAIIRCGARGYDLPSDKYEQWRDIEMTFNPERMRIK